MTTTTTLTSFRSEKYASIMTQVMNRIVAGATFECVEAGENDMGYRFDLVIEGQPSARGFGVLARANQEAVGITLRATTRQDGEIVIPHVNPDLYLMHEGHYD